MIAEFCEDWGALPYAGGLLDQPVRLIVLGSQLRAYTRAAAQYEADPQHTPAAMRDLVLMTARESALRRERGE